MTTTDDATGSLAEAFTREHHEIDAGIEAYLAAEVGVAGAGAAEATSVAAEHAEPVHADAGHAERAAPLRRALDALRRHIYLEEEIVFPHLPGGALMMPLMVMRREHGELWRRMDALDARLDDPSATPEGTAAACAEMLELLEAHNAKEEPIIYPYMDSDLTDDEAERVRALLADGELPAGWVCQAIQA